MFHRPDRRVEQSPSQLFRPPDTKRNKWSRKDQFSEGGVYLARRKSRPDVTRAHLVKCALGGASPSLRCAS